MANETTIGQLVIDLKIKTEAIEKGLETAKSKLKEIESSNNQVENSNKSLDASYLAMSATAVMALGKIVSSIKDCVNEYNSYTQSMSSLQNVSEYTGESMTDLSKIMNKFGVYMTKADLATTIKNFSLMGFEAQQTEQMIEALTNSAIRNRNANYTVSEAVRVASEGYRQGLSTLSDSAGVTENLSVMLDMYAKSIGKTASQLTEAEKNQAYLNRTMYAAEPFASAMSDYLETLAGKQGQYSQAMRETQVAYTEAIEPMLIGITEKGTQALNLVNEFIKAHPHLTAGATSFAVTLSTVTIGLTALTTAKKVYEKVTGVATLSVKNFTKALMANPITLVALGISAAISGITMLTNAINEQNEATEKLRDITERYNEIKNDTFEYNEENKSTLKTDKANIEEQINLMEKLKEINDTIQSEGSNGVSGIDASQINLTATSFDNLSESLDNSNNKLSIFSALSQNANIRTKEQENRVKNFREANSDLKQEYQNVSKKLQENIKENGKYGNSLFELRKKQEQNTKALDKYSATEKIKNAIDITTQKNQQKEAAQLKVNVQTMQEYLNVVKKGDTSTSQYQEAVKQLAKAYPEAANAQGIIIDKAQDYINAEQAKADQAWNTSQTTISGSIEVINTFIEMARQAENDATKQQELANAIGISYSNIIPTLTSVLNILNAMGNAAPAAVAGVEPVSVSAPKLRGSGGGSGSKATKTYENKALDNYKKQIEHKKALDQLSLQQEIAMYQTALNKYAKTQDEKWELTEKIYSLQKELQEKSLDDYTANIEHKKVLDKVSLQQEIAMYQTALNKYAKTTEQKREMEEKLHELRKELAQKEKELLEQKTTEYQRYIQDKKSLRGAEYDVKEQEKDLNKIISLHKNYLNQIMKDERLSLDERKQIYQEELDVIRDYEQQKRDLRVQSVDDTVSQLTNAITKQLEEMEEADKKAIEDNIKLVEKWKEARINAINEEYNARIEAIQKELDLLDKSEEEKTRAEEDAEHQRKKKRLEELIAYEHDATTKANYQKELDKLVAEYQKTLDKRALQDKKDALKEKQELLKEEQTNKVQAIEDEADKQKEQYDKQLEKVEEYYNKQKDLAQEIAEKMLLNVGKNQNQILKLLSSYGNAYEITGQTLGEKLAQGINNGVANKIQNIIQRIQDTIDAGIENKIKQWTSGMYKYEAGVNKPQTKTISITQQNYIEQSPEMPSETYRKLNNISEGLAAEIARM